MSEVLRVSKRIDLTGQQINEWTVLEYLGDRKYLCRCSCGVEKPVSAYSLTSGASKSCGHAELVYKPIEVGDTYGSLKVVRYAGNYSWECQCKCGRTVIALGKYLKNGKITSCGNHKAEDLTGKTFGYWKVIKYAGNLRWTCQCKCGTVRDVLTQALKSGRSKSCGCGGIDVAANYREKMLAKYGDISINRAGNPRELWQIETLNDSEKLKAYLEKFKAKHSRKPTITDLTALLSTSFSQIAKTIHKYKLDSYIEMYGNTSNLEKELADFVRSIYSGKFETRNRSIIAPYELDIVLPEEKIAIEFNGNYWHSELVIPNKLYHSNKTDMCNAAGYRLIHIFEYEWLLNKDKIKQYLTDILVKPKIIYARNCSVEQISSDKAIEFLNANHLQGYAKSQVHLGLIHNNELVGVMTFGLPRFNQTYEYELVRLAYKSGIGVTGGTAKLFNYFIKKFNPKSIICYSDRTKFTGNSYSNIGMQLNEVSKPGYIWIDAKMNVVTRYNSMKHKLVKLGLGDDSQSEAEIMYSMGYYRIYDCGNKVFTWEHKQGGID